MCIRGPSYGLLATILLSVVTSLVTSQVLYNFLYNYDPIITLPKGTIRGHVLRSENGNFYYAFQEIPYASPPVGKFRFKPPIPPKRWKGVLNAQKNSKICYQQNEENSPIPNVTETEDCLYLNVYTPQRPGSSILLPVYVWIHGGAFRIGSGTFQQYGPKFLIDSNIVIVTMNYRLGPLGFLTTNDAFLPGNLGLKDQNFALKWVKQNINLFGGDPDKVTIGGGSSGGLSVGCHVISKQSEELFRGAILQSGTVLTPVTYQVLYRSLAFQLGRALDHTFDSDKSKDLLELLRNTSARDIVNTKVCLPRATATSLVWAPIIEDKNIEGAFLTSPFHEDIKNGNINRVPLIIGFTSGEYKFFAALDLPGLKRTGIEYDRDPSILLEQVFNIKDSNKAKAGRELRRIYTNTTFQDNLAGLLSYMSDFVFTTPCCRHADLQSRYTDVYLYQLSYKGSLGYAGLDTNIEGIDPNGVGHVEDISYVWDTGVNSDSCKYPKEDILTRNRIMKLWSNFIKYLNPTPNEDRLLQNVIWPPVEKGRLNYLHINSTLQTGVDPKHYKEWKKVVDAYAIPPYIMY